MANDPYDLFAGTVANIPDLNTIKEKARDILQIPVSAGLDIQKWLNSSTANIPDPFREFNFRFKSGRVSFEEYEKNFLPKVPNILQSANPIGFQDVISVLETLMDDLSDDERHDYNAARYRINRVLVSIEKFLEEDTTPEFIRDNFPELDSSFLLDFKINWKTFLTNADTSLRDQLIDLRGYLVFYSQKVMDAVFEMPEGYQENSRASANFVNAIIDDIDSILTEWAMELEVMVERLINLLTYSDAKKVHRYRLTNVQAALKNPLFNLVKSDYIRTQSPSTSVLATSFARKEVNPRDQIDAAQAALPPAKIAKPDIGVGDKIQEEKQVDTVEYTATVGPLTEAQFNQLIDKLKQRESSGNYRAVNQIGYCGAWQWGAPGLIDMGYVKSGTSTRSLKSDSCWTGKDGISVRDDFLGNKDKVQDKLIVRWMKYNYKRLLALNVLTKEDTAAQVAGMLCVCHLLGPGGARDFKNGKNRTDANGTGPQEYFNLGSSAVGGSTTATPQEAQENAQKVDMQTIDDSATVNVPEQSAAPVYPYNKVKHTESGHFEEYDDTPGAERIQVRHRKGSGYELKEDGDTVYFSSKNNYDAVLGDNHIIVSGLCNIYVKGNCGIISDGDMNINAGQNLNLIAGGDVNVVAGGNKSERISGSSSTNVSGDAATSIGGFHRLAADGDLQIESGSLSAISRAGNLNLISKGDVNTVTEGNINQNAIGNISTVAKGNTISVAYGDQTIVASAKMVINGDSLVAYGKSTANLGSSSSTTIAGSGVIKLGAPVEKAQYSDTAGRAPDGSASPVNPSGSATDGGGASVASGKKSNVEKDKVEKIVDTFSASNFDKTQAYAGGGDGVPASKVDPYSVA
uniref:Baseplate hub subunit and tail lysozyme n=1 Tax=Ochrobactrum phage ORM_20 TaxID=2985243 RepID=A0A9N6WTV7_9VIRU|nr:baseplate hub subunit and tail lysozyme [Ochrobactrum phage ORM_20]